jgi:hypothetical protein
LSSSSSSSPPSSSSSSSSSYTVPLTLEFGSISLMKWQLQAQLLEQWRAQEELGLAQEGESDGLRQLLTETEPWLIAVTTVLLTFCSSAVRVVTSQGGSVVVSPRYTQPVHTCVPVRTKGVAWNKPPSLTRRFTSNDL